MPSPADDLLTTDIDAAIDCLRAGGLVAIPTETVYGLAADAEQDDAVARIYEVKGRPTDHPLIVHVGGLDELHGWVDEVTADAHTLGTTCWPGPLTMLLRRGLRASDTVTAGRGTVGVRAPSHPATNTLLHRFGGGLAAPSANRFGKVSPTTAQHVLDDIGELLVPGRDLVLDGGPCDVGVESTIVDLTTEPPQVLRAGAIAAEEISRLLASPLAAASGPSRTSGMLDAHYEPDCRLLLTDTRADAEQLAAELAAAGHQSDVLDRTDDVVAAARLLYDDLRRADAAGLDTLVVVLPEPVGLGVAVTDRLHKAAAGSSRPR